MEKEQNIRAFIISRNITHLRERSDISIGMNFFLKLPVKKQVKMDKLFCFFSSVTTSQSFCTNRVRTIRKNNRLLYVRDMFTSGRQQKQLKLLVFETTQLITENNRLLYGRDKCMNTQKEPFSQIVRQETYVFSCFTHHSNF